MLCHAGRLQSKKQLGSQVADRRAGCSRADAPRVPERAPLGLLTAFDATSAAGPAAAATAHSGLDRASAAGGGTGYNGAAARGSAAQGLLRLRDAGGTVASETGSGGAQPPCSGLSGTAGRHITPAAGVDVRQGVGHKRSGANAGLLPTALSQRAQAPRLGATGAAGSSPGSAAAELAMGMAQHPLACGVPRQQCGASTAQPEHAPPRHMAAPARPSSGGMAAPRHDLRRQPTPHKVLPDSRINRCPAHLLAVGSTVHCPLLMCLPWFWRYPDLPTLVAGVPR